jgi:hypothetical protein
MVEVCCILSGSLGEEGVIVEVCCITTQKSRRMV